MNNTTTPKKRPNYAPEVRQRAVRMVLDHQADYPSRWAAIDSVAKKIGCAPQSLHEWVRKTEVDSGKRAGITVPPHLISLRGNYGTTPPNQFSSVRLGISSPALLDLPQREG